MDWLYVVIVSYFILSISNLVDKIFLTNIVAESVIYAFWVSFLSVAIVSAFVIHWRLDHEAYVALKALGDLTLMTPWFVTVSILTGILFTLSIYLLYTALQKGEASRVIPLIGGSMPILIFAMTFYSDTFTLKILLAFVFLVLGTILISLMPKSMRAKKSLHDIYLALGASLSFAVFFVLTQYIFRNHGFINGIVWPRLGSFFAIVLLFAFPGIRKKIRYSLNHLSVKLRLGWLANQGLGALGFLGQQYVISIPGVSVALVSALQSIQYAFLLVFASLLSVFKPTLLSERVTTPIILQKVLAAVCIGIGLYLIST